MCIKQSLPVKHCGSVSHPDERQFTTPVPLIPKPTLQVYTAVDPSSVTEYTGVAAFTTIQFMLIVTNMLKYVFAYVQAKVI